MEAKFIYGKIELFTKEQAESMSVEKAFEKAPFIIHHAFCSKLVEIAKKNINVNLTDIPKASKVMNAIEVLEELYPNIKL
ncbi:MAG: hypothetical protein ACWA5P_01705 [bacterium]